MDKVEKPFNYDEFITRNIGFVTREEQERLRRSSVFICGVGGMGGACLQSLARLGIAQFIIADMDEFEVSNFNRQVFANLKTAGMQKTEATRAAVKDINPEASVEVYDGAWLGKLPEILPRVDLVVNGMDDIGAGVQLYRAARALKLAVIDAYAASLPSVYVTRPHEPAPEDRLGYPTRGKRPEEWTKDTLSEAFLRELEYVMGLSSTRHYIDLSLGAEMAAGKRKRMSFAPMVITTGNLMAYEAVNVLLSKPYGTDCRGYFFNPYTCKTERPPPGPVVRLLRWIARKKVAELMSGKA